MVLPGASTLESASGSASTEGADGEGTAGRASSEAGVGSAGTGSEELKRSSSGTGSSGKRESAVLYGSWTDGVASRGASTETTGGEGTAGTTMAGDESAVEAGSVKLNRSSSSTGSSGKRVSVVLSGASTLETAGVGVSVVASDDEGTTSRGRSGRKSSGPGVESEGACLERPESSSCWTGSFWKGDSVGLSDASTIGATWRSSLTEGEDGAGGRARSGPEVDSMDAGSGGPKRSSS